MTSNHLKLVCAVVCLQASWSQAQDTEALSRAQRDAANPMRMIIEASKLKPRQKSAEADAAAKPLPEKVTARPIASKPAASTRTEQIAKQPEAPAHAPTPAPTSTASATPLPKSTEAPTETPTEAPAPTEAASPPLALNEPSTAETALATPTPRAVLQLVDYVEPVMPERLRRRLQVDGDVVVNFTVNPDGSVADVAVRSSNDRALDPIALDAVRQWRYQPIAVAQSHAVQLVFRLHD